MKIRKLQTKKFHNIGPWCQRFTLAFLRRRQWGNINWGLLLASFNLYAVEQQNL
jgi:hypothetical protein